MNSACTDRRTVLVGAVGCVVSLGGAPIFPLAACSWARTVVLSSMR